MRIFLLNLSYDDVSQMLTIKSIDYLQGKRISNAIDKRIVKRHHVGINEQQE